MDCIKEKSHNEEINKVEQQAIFLLISIGINASWLDFLKKKKKIKKIREELQGDELNLHQGESSYIIH